MNKYYDLLNRIYKLESLIYNRVPVFESIDCYKSTGEFIKANGQDEIYSILEDKIKRSLNITSSNLDDILAAIDDDSHTVNLQTVINKIIRAGKGELPSKIIYRGCSEAEYNNILKNGSSGINRCLSFSESKKVASKFGKRIIAAKFTFQIFPFYKLYLYYFLSLKKSLTKSEWQDLDNAIDAQYGIDLAIHESEWIAPENTVFTLNNDGTFIATIGESTNNNDNSNAKHHLEDLCDALEISNYNIDGHYKGKDSCNIHINPNNYVNKLVSKIALSHITSSDIALHYIYDSNTLEIFAPGIGIVDKTIDISQLNKNSFSKLVKSMLDSRL